MSILTYLSLGVHISSSVKKGILHDHTLSRFTTTCKPLIKLQSKKSWLQVKHTQTHKKTLIDLCGLMKQNQNDKCVKATTSSVNMAAFLLWLRNVWVPIELANQHVLMISQLIDAWINAEVYMSSLCAQIQTEASKLVGQHFVIQQDKATAWPKEPKQGEEVEYSRLS